MQEKVDPEVQRIVEETFTQFLEEVGALIDNPEKQKLEDILSKHFINAFKKAEDNEMHESVYHNLLLVFYPDYLKDSEKDSEEYKAFRQKVFSQVNISLTQELSKKIPNYLKDTEYQKLPREVLFRVNISLIKELIKKARLYYLQFFEDFLLWSNEFFLKIIIPWNCSDPESQEYKTAKTKLEKHSFIWSKIYSMQGGIEKYFFPIKYVTKILRGLLSIPSRIVYFIALYVSALIIKFFNRLLRPPVMALIKLITGDEFNCQFLKQKKSKSQALFNRFSFLAKAYQDSEPYKAAIQTECDSMAENNTKNRSLLWLKLIALTFFHSLFQDISDKSVGDKALFILSWPFRLIAMTILFILATPIELTKLVIKIAFIAVTFVLIAANVSLLFILNLPHYMFEISSAFINWLRSEPNNFVVIEDNPSDGINPPPRELIPQPPSINTDLTNLKVVDKVDLTIRENRILGNPLNYGKS